MATWHDTVMSRIDELLDDQPLHMSVKDVAQVLGVTERTIVRWLKTGELPGLRLPNQWLVLREDLRQWLRAAYNQPDAEGGD